MAPVLSAINKQKGIKVESFNVETYLKMCRFHVSVPFRCCFCFLVVSVAVSNRLFYNVLTSLLRLVLNSLLLETVSNGAVSASYVIRTLNREKRGSIEQCAMYMIPGHALGSIPPSGSFVE